MRSRIFPSREVREPRWSCRLQSLRFVNRFARSASLGQRGIAGMGVAVADTKLILPNARRLFRNRDVPAFFTKADDAPKPPEVSGFTQQRGRWEYPLTMSPPERAIPRTA